MNTVTQMKSSVQALKAFQSHPVKGENLKLSVWGTNTMEGEDLASVVLWQPCSPGL